MTYDFFADKTDKLTVLDFIFNETDLQVFDLSSPYGQNINQYKSSKEITAKFDLLNGDKFAVTFQLWTPRHKGKAVFKKIDLDPRRCNGHTFRYSTEGWGMIQLYFGGLKNGNLHLSHIGHFNEKGAAKWEGINTFNGSVSAWNWKEIQVTSRKLKSHIHNKLTVNKIGSVGVLPGANAMQSEGVNFVTS